jgi:hypothetical protein
MKNSKIKSFVFGLAFLGSMGFGGINSQAQDSVEPGGGNGTSRCYQRMYWCSGEVEVYNCENYQTGKLCSAAYEACYKCS